DLAVIGIGLPEQYRTAFVSHSTPPPPQPGFSPVGKSGYLLAIESSRVLPSEVTILGYEPINVAYGQIDHSWLCNHLELYAADNLRIRPGSTGLLQSLSEAPRCCEAFEEPQIGAEPGPWFPWLLARYEDAV